MNFNNFRKFVVGPEVVMNRDNNWFIYVHLCLTLM